MAVPLDEYNALRNGQSFVELPGWSSVTFIGADRQSFLNSFCTNDVKRLAPRQSCEAFFTNVKGKVLGHGLVECRERELVFVSVPGQAATLVEHLDRYIIREDVQLRDTTAERAYLYLSDGPVTADLPARWIPWPLLVRASGGLLEVSPAVVPRVQETLVDGKAKACDPAAFDALRIEAGMPLFGMDFDANNLPQEVARNDRAISFTKGCYLGQETVARIDAMGHVNQQLTGVRFVGTLVPTAGTALTHNGSPAGHVTSATFSPQLDAPLALAMVRREWLAPGSKLDSPVGPCEVVRLPLGA